MKPKFDNKGLNILYNVLIYGCAGATGLTLAMYKSGKVSYAVMIAIVSVTVLLLLFDFGWSFFIKKNEPLAVEDAPEGEGVSTADFDINEVSAARTPQRVIKAALAILLLLIAWGWALSQHLFDGVFFMDKPLITFISFTLLSLGALLMARFPFLMDEGHMKTMSQVNLSISFKQDLAILVALALVFDSFLQGEQGMTTWQYISLVVLFLIWVVIDIYFYKRNKQLSAQIVSSDGADSFNLARVKVFRTVEGTVFEVITLVILAVAWYFKLSAQGLSVSSIFQTPQTTLIISGFSVACLIFAYLPDWSKGNVKKYINIRQVALYVRKQRIWAVEFALLALWSSFYNDMKYEAIPGFIALGIMVMFAATWLIFNWLHQRAKGPSAD